MKIAGYGIQLVVFGFVIFGIFMILALITPEILLLTILAILSGIFAVFNLFFFRDPDRKIIKNEKTIVSPADGKVVLIKDTEEQEFFKGPAIQISIFLSVFNVHVNRNPIGGKVDYYRYKTGEFLAAFREEASQRNEQSVIGITGSTGRVLFKLIAGLIARRVICELKEGDTAVQGDRIGMIRYGSRADVFLPAGSKVLVKTGDKVIGGLSVIGEFNG